MRNMVWLVVSIIIKSHAKLRIKRVQVTAIIEFTSSIGNDISVSSRARCFLMIAVVSFSVFICESLNLIK